VRKPKSRSGMTTTEIAAVAAIFVLFTATVAFFEAGAANKSDVTNLQSQVSSLESSSSSATHTALQTVAQASQVAPTARHITLVAEPATITLATNVTYDAWTFNGTVPGPTIWANQGDTIVATFVNDFTTMAHSIDFHAGQVSWSADYQPIAPANRRPSTSPSTIRACSCIIAGLRQPSSTSPMACMGR